MIIHCISGVFFDTPSPFTISDQFVSSVGQRSPFTYNSYGTVSLFLEHEISQFLALIPVDPSGQNSCFPRNKLHNVVLGRR